MKKECQRQLRCVLCCRISFEVSILTQREFNKNAKNYVKIWETVISIMLQGSEEKKKHANQVAAACSVLKYPSYFTYCTSEGESLIV